MILNKDLLFKYLDDTYNKNKHLFTYRYFKAIKKIFNNIEVSEQLTDLALIKTLNPYTQDYDLGDFGLYHIDFNIKHLLYLIDNDQIQLESYESSKVNFNMIYHEYLDFFNMSINYDSKIIVTDFITKDCYFTIIDGNHTFEKYLLENEQFNIHYLPFYQIPRSCYCNDFSYVFHYIINEFYLIFYEEQDINRQKQLIKNSKIFFMVKELL